MNCVDCLSPLGKRSVQKAKAGAVLSGQCAKCWHFSRRKPPPLCRDCSAPITRMSAGGRCRPCGHRHARLLDPTIEPRRIATVRLSMKNPQILEMKQRVARENAAAHLTWMPRQYRDAYRHLRKNKGFNAAEAQRLIREQMAADFRGIDPFAVALLTSGLAKAA